MISLRLSKKDELEIFNEMDSQDHAKKFVNQNGLKTHNKYYSDPKITYLSIDNNSGEFCGYLILVFEPNTKCVEFRRILIDQKQLGIGQMAISKMEGYCIENYEVNRIWLDVYEDNQIGIHIYEKMGYKRFNEELVEGRKLYFYEKVFSQ